MPIISPLLSGFFDILVFRKLRALSAFAFSRPSPAVFAHRSLTVGGRMRAMLSGGAPLSQETQRFMRTCFGIPMLQGYGLTESCGMCAVQPLWHSADKTVGMLMPCCEVKLVDIPGTKAPRPPECYWPR